MSRGGRASRREPGDSQTAIPVFDDSPGLRYTLDVWRPRIFSLALYKRVVERLAEEPSLIQRAADRIDSPTYSPTHAAYASRWRALLAGPRDELLAKLVEDSDDAQSLRQASPFAFVLTSRERYAIWKACRRDARAA